MMCFPQNLHNILRPTRSGRLIHESSGDANMAVRMSQKTSTGEEAISGSEDVVVETHPMQRVPGLWKGEFDIPDSFFDPLPPEELEGWE
jgi:hypothetical protein